MLPTLPLQIPVADDPVVLAFGTLYLLIVLAIGIWGYTKTDSMSDFMITGKRIGTWVLALTAFSVIQSGFGFVGGPELIYAFGMTAVWIFFAAPIGFIITWMLIAKKMRVLADVRNVLTLPDAVYVRYESQTLRGLMGVVILVGVIAYLATQLAALQAVMRAIFGIPLVWGLLLGAGILVLYSVLGGMIAGVYTDALQGATMIGGAVLVFLYALSFGGGISGIAQNLASANPGLIGPFGTFGGSANTAAIGALTFWILFTIGIVGQPHLVTKFYMIRDVKLLKLGAPIATLSYLISSLLALGAGLAMRAQVEAGAIPALESASQAMPVFVLNHTNSIIAGLILAALLAAIMSTSDSFLNIGAAAVSRDIPRALDRPIESDRVELRVTQGALIGMTVIAVLVVQFSDALIGILGTIGAAFFIAAILPVVILGLNWQGATTEGAIAAILVSWFVNITYSVLPTAFSTFGMSNVANTISATNPLPGGFVTGTAATLIAVVVFIVVSVLTQDGRDVPSDLVALIKS